MRVIKMATLKASPVTVGHGSLGPIHEEGRKQQHRSDRQTQDLVQMRVV